MKACPICSRSAPRAPENPHAPFCSDRCKLIDLGNWVTGAYRLDEDAPPIPLPPRPADGGEA